MTINLYITYTNNTIINMEKTKIVILFCTIFLLISSNNIVFSANYHDKNDDTSLTVKELPQSFSWRNIDGVDYSTSVKDQQPCAACESFAIVSIIETLVQYKVGYPFDCDLSEALLFFMNNGSCKYGANFTKMLNFLMKYGVPDEGAFPYENRNYETPISEAVNNWKNRTVKISEWGWVENTEESIKKALIEHGPIFALINYSWDFLQYKSGVFYPNRKLIPAHAIAIFGYNDTGRFWIIKNSWGNTWGEDGWFKLSYDADMFITGKGTQYENITGGGTGIFYIDGVYGNLKPDVPIVKIIQPERSYSYFKEKYWKNLILRSVFRNEFMVWIEYRYIQKTLFGEVRFDTRTPKIFKVTNIIVNTTGNNISKVEIYVDNVLKHTSLEPSFEWYWNVDVENGKHEIKAVAYNNMGSISKAIRDVYTFK